MNKLFHFRNNSSNSTFGLFTLFFLVLVFSVGLLLTACNNEEIARFDFARLNVMNLSSTNSVDVLTNVDILDITPNMYETLNNLSSSEASIKEVAYYHFITNSNIFNWQSSTSLQIEYGESEQLFINTCGSDKVVKAVKKNSFNGVNIAKKVFYGIIRPMDCGYSYTIFITNQ